MKKIFGLLALSLLISCEDDISTNNPDPNPNEDNVLLASSFLYGNVGINPDSMLVNNLGYAFFVTDMSLVFSSIYFVEGGDSVAGSTDPFVVSLGSFDQFVLKLLPGGYSGDYRLELGMDSLTGATFDPAALPANDPLIEADVFRLDGTGIDQIIIKGRMIDPTDPLDTIGNLPFEYRIGTDITTRYYQSLQQNFSVTRNAKAKLIMQIDLEPVLKDFDILATPYVVSDPSVPVDMAKAVEMADNLSIGLY